MGRCKILGRWKIFPATTALAAAVIATTASLPVFARELQPLAQIGATPKGRRYLVWVAETFDKPTIVRAVKHYLSLKS